MDQHQLADVVQQARQGETIAVLMTHLEGDPVRGALGGKRMEAEALRGGSPNACALEEVEGALAAGERLEGLGAQRLDGRDRGIDTLAASPLGVGEAQNGKDESDIGLDRRDDLGRRGVALAERRQQAVA